jgi:hypothetical protein
MDRMIRNINPTAYRRLKAIAAAEGRPIGAVLTDAINLYVWGSLKPPKRARKGRGLADLPVFDFGPGSERWSENKNEALYGDQQ